MIRKRARKGKKKKVNWRDSANKKICLICIKFPTNLNIFFHELRVSLLYSKCNLKFCMQRARECLWDFHQICPKPAQFINFVWTTLEKKKKILWFTYAREACGTFAVKSGDDSLYGEHTPPRDEAVAALQAQLQPGAGRLVYLLPGNPIYLVRFISFPQSHLQLSQVKTTMRLTRKRNRPFLKKSDLFSPWCYIATC